MYDFSIIGGDRRQVYMAQLLCKNGYRVMGYGLDMEEGLDIKTAGSLKEAAREADTVIGPVPLTRDRETVFGRMGKTDLTLEQLKNSLCGGKRFFAGAIPAELKEFGQKKRVFIYDFMDNEELAVFNSVATAEGAVAEAIIRYPGNLNRSECLVLGFGRCGKTLSEKLAGLSARVTVCARKSFVRAEAEAIGFTAVDFPELEKRMESYQLIFNTVPSLVLDRRLLSRIQSPALILDLASAPGGVDYQAAREKKLTARLCPGLPGKYAPLASAEALTAVLLNEINS